MTDHYVELKSMFIRTKEAIQSFMAILTPRIENAKDDHERLYYHHIYEEEEQRLDRLEALLPKLDFYVDNDEARTVNNLEFVRLLQDISLEKFGLHNFLEHLDLSLFSFKDTEYAEKLEEMRNTTNLDYQLIKEILQTLNESFDGAATAAGSIPTDEKEEVDHHLKIDTYTRTENDEPSINPEQKIKPRKQLTVGSLKNM